MREHVAELVLRDLADVGGLAAERGDAGDRVRGRSARGLDAGAHDRVQPIGRGGVDEVHRALGQAVLLQEGIVRLRQDVHDGVADTGDIKLCVLHQDPRKGRQATELGGAGTCRRWRQVRS